MKSLLSYKLKMCIVDDQKRLQDKIVNWQKVRLIYVFIIMSIVIVLDLLLKAIER